jgi:hypothetical protein
MRDTMAEGAPGGKPADFFIGLVDFFAILLPGAMFAFVLYKCVERWDATLTGSYLPDSWGDLPGVFRPTRSLREWRPRERGSHEKDAIHRRADGDHLAGGR